MRNDNGAVLARASVGSGDGFGLHSARGPRVDTSLGLDADASAAPEVDEAETATPPHGDKLAPTGTVADAPARPAAESPAGIPAAGGIGVSGERLTRQEAFTLVGSAVAALTSGDRAVPASRVREQAFKILGRDSESLSERNFIRILKDAHDGDVVDLRRRGDDYEVAVAVQAAPVADQLSNAAAAMSHRPMCRPDMNATIDPNTAPPAPTGATTLPIQLMKLKNAPSGCAPV